MTDLYEAGDINQTDGGDVDDELVGVDEADEVDEVDEVDEGNERTATDGAHRWRCWRI